MSDGQIHNPPPDRPAEVWLPAGEVYTVPETTSVSGTVVVPFLEYRGMKVRSLRLAFQNGTVTQMTATENGKVVEEAMANASGGKDRFSFIDIGVNPNSRMIPNSDYCTYEMTGMVTIGVGTAPWAGLTNETDFALGMFIPHATLEVDGKMIISDGKIQI